MSWLQFTYTHVDSIQENSSDSFKAFVAGSSFNAQIFIKNKR